MGTVWLSNRMASSIATVRKPNASVCRFTVLCASDLTPVPLSEIRERTRNREGAGTLLDDSTNRDLIYAWLSCFDLK
jgi:hypothetical protein